MDKPSQNYILCMKWGQKYGAEYVNRLYNMVKRHLTLPFTMICLTDDTKGIDPAVQCHPLIPLDLPNGLPERGWNKLTTFSANLYGLQGTALFLDIDIVIIDNIDCFFTHPSSQDDEVWIIRDWKKPWRKVGNSSVYRFQIGALPDLMDYFHKHFQHIRQQFRHEQAFLSWYVRENHRLSYWPDNWCLSYKYNVLKKMPYALWQPPEKPNYGKIIVFHGEVNPPDAIRGGGGKWYRKVLPAPWLKNYWQ
ncbi:glycosyltransferase [Snodgrassella alvi]|uniref:Glycosyltransferase n=2 Tax=Snodgrassella alvi TaxID=1196083 RepID=A0A2N9WSA1_9NEIS|nr:glycosyltransferase [Snodgrassella alvi]